MKTIDIPGGQATLRDPAELSPRQRNLIKAAGIAAASVIAKVENAMERAPDGEETEEQIAAREKRNEGALLHVDMTRGEALRLIEMRESTIIATLVSWTLPRPLPTLDTLSDLPQDLYDALDASIGGMSAALSHVNFEPGPPDKAVPTGPSSDSAGSLRVETEASPSMPTQRSDGVPTSGESFSPASPLSNS